MKTPHAAFLANQIFPIEYAGNQQHADAEQRYRGVVDVMQTDGHPKNRYQEKHQQHQPF
jgi:uncharacterized protein YegL